MRDQGREVPMWLDKPPLAYIDAPYLTFLKMAQMWREGLMLAYHMDKVLGFSTSYPIFGSNADSLGSS